MSLKETWRVIYRDNNLINETRTKIGEHAVDEMGSKVKEQEADWM